MCVLGIDKKIEVHCMKFHFYVVQNEHFYVEYHAIFHQKQREDLNQGMNTGIQLLFLERLRGR